MAKDLVISSDDILPISLDSFKRQDTMNVHNLFPTPVFFFKYTKDFNKKELDFILNQEHRPNMGNTTSIDNYILKNAKMKNIASFIQTSVDKYFDEVYKPKNNVKLEISQSWLNYSKPGQWHHKHAHPNSFISGVFYIKANVAKDKIYFYKDQYQQLKVPPRDWNTWNSESWWFSVDEYDLVLFPSSLTHMVETVEEDEKREERISLSFNTFLKGYVGNDDELTGLHL